NFVPTHVCESAAELAAELGLPGEELTRTIEAYNAGARHGTDPEFHKASHWVRPLEGALGATSCGSLRTFTLGGLVTDVDSRVLRDDGTPVRRLYAAGRVASGLPAWGYVSGSSLGDCTYFGRRAGRSAAGVLAAR
ncbi:MAG TPA: FAD-binding protein, partial [Ilumatobacteraceae bacterium]|nr:FAD-binding protein [Ilumatobacteraceae bacterium]